MNNDATLRLLALSRSRESVQPVLENVNNSTLSTQSEIVDSPSLLKQLLVDGRWDAILLLDDAVKDNLREWTEIATRHACPLILVHGAGQTIDEETARRLGVNDLVDARNNARLVFTVQREVERSRLRSRLEALEKRLEQLENRTTSHQTEQSFRNLVENDPFGVYIVDHEFKLQLVSAGARKVFANIHPLIGRDFAEVMRTTWPEPFATEAIQRFRTALETGEPYQSSATVEFRKDLEVVEYYDWRIERIVLPDGHYGIVCHFYDLSERYRWERALRESEEKFSTIVHRLPVGIALVDEEGVMQSMNPAALRMHCFDSQDQMLAESSQYAEDYELRYPDGRSMPLRDWPLMRAMRGEAVNNYEVYLRCLPKDENRYISYSCLRLNEADGPERFMLVMQDLTQRRSYEKALQESRESLRLLSNPVLQVSRNVLLLPLIGAVDEERGTQLENQLLDQIREYRAQVVVIDVTGAINVDKSAISCLVRTIKAAKLLGCQSVLTGISPTLAERFVQLRTSLDFVHTTGSLDSGLEKAYQLVKTCARQLSPLPWHRSH